jgi:glycosyltransferase involved in cell wall biosynthesis
MRIAVHDYAGHPFQFDLSRQLARNGHEVRHCFFGEDVGPKGDLQRRPDDPPGFSIEPIRIGRDYRKDRFIQRRADDLAYGRKAGAHIAAFRPDVVISGNTPLEAQRLVMASARRAGAAFVFWMQDFYSLAVERLLGARWLGVGAAIAAFYKAMEADLLRRSDRIVLISDDFLAGLAELGVRSNGVDVIPNWGALDAIPVRPRRNAWSDAQGLSDGFVFLYSGTLGLKHDPKVLTALADAFADQPQVRVVVIATGMGFAALQAELAVRPRPNLVTMGLQPFDQLPNVLGAADVVLALLEPDAGRFSAPSKVLSYFCAGRPVLLSAPPENLAARTVKAAAAGAAVEAGDVQAFIAAARQLYSDSAARSAAGASGRRYAEANFDVGEVAKRFEAVFARALVNRGGQVSSPPPV